MAFSADFIDRLKAANPIEEVMREYVTTKRTGRDYVCLCPFHNEKTPSCHIHPERGYFHCFGCNAGGDVITFIMKYRNLDYVETIKYLADRAHMELPLDSFGGGDGGSREKRQRIYEINDRAAKFFNSRLATEEGRKCLDYLVRVRGLNAETIKRYKMGCAPNSWTALKEHMMGLGYSEKELIEAGLLTHSQNESLNTRNSFDFFKDRAMFPFIDLTGHIIGFGGRALGTVDKRKYLNSRDTAVYNKNRFLFSMNFAKNEAVKTRQILLCEGNLDVISLSQAGFGNAVASCGTALTQEQVRLISGYAEEVIICYDSDEAGRKATNRALDMLGQAGLKVRVITMKGAKDPDEYVRRFGADAFAALLKDSSGAVNYRLQLAESSFDMQDDAGKLAFKDEAVKILSKIESPVERDLYGHKAAEKLGVSYEVLRQELDNAGRKKFYSDRRRMTNDAMSFVNLRDPVNREATVHRREVVAEEVIISYLAANPEYYKVLKDALPPERFVTDFDRRVYTYIMQHIGSGTDWSLGTMSEEFSFEEVGSISRIFERCAAEGITRESADACIEVLNNYTPPNNGAPSIDDLEALRRSKRRG